MANPEPKTTRRRRDPGDDIPLNHGGLCLCGCGRGTKIATYTVRHKGIVKGVPLRYADGHKPKTARTTRYEVLDRGCETPCWIWTGPITRMGYGRHGAESSLAHRVLYEERHGALPKGVLLHHRCDQKDCVRPDHLQPMTRASHLRLHRKKRSSAGDDPPAEQSQQFSAQLATS